MTESSGSPPPKARQDDVVKLARQLGKASLPIAERLEILAQAVDGAMDLGSHELLTAVINRSRPMLSAELDDESMVRLHYYIANAHSARARLTIQPWAWENPDEAEAILHLRRAIAFNRNLVEWPWHTEEVSTNLGNAYSRMGRPFKAVEYWQHALFSEHGFGPAELNWAEAVHKVIQFYPLRPDEAAWLTNHAAARIAGALSSPKLDTHGMRHDAESLLKNLTPLPPLPPTPQAVLPSEAAAKYAEWIRRQHFDLDLVRAIEPDYPRRGDPAHIEDMRADAKLGVSPFVLFNVLKREYTSARYFAYESSGKGATIADEGIRFKETMDFAYLGHRAECGKAAFRAAYSLFERIAVFLNAYYQLNLQGEFTFRNLWYIDGAKSKGLRPQFKDRKNWPLRGLFWLSKDLYENAVGYHETTNPDARTLSELRNELEHRFVSLHAIGDLDDKESRMFGTTLGRPIGYHMGWPNFRSHLTQLLSIAREAILYLGAAIAFEERSSGSKYPMELGDWNPEYLTLVWDYT